MLTKITFQNLRCFEDFTLDRMTPLTLISGKNNVGKTSILEGVFLLLAYRKADVFININSFRGIDVVSPLPPGLILGQEPPHLWETLFRNLDTKQKLTISIEDDNKRLRTLCMEKDEQFSQTSFTERNAVPPMFQPLSGSYALKFMYEDGADSNETGRFLVTQSGLTLMFDTPSYLPVLPFVIYISPNTHLSQQIVATWTGEIEYKNKKNELVKMLRLLFDEIEDIFVMQQHGTANIFSRLQNGHPLPIRAMGDGINKLLHYLAVMIANPGGIFLFDEIETGFHYSFYPKLWEIISTVAQNTKSQVIATTHSYECIESAVKGTSKVDPSLLTYVRLAKENNKIVPYYFYEKDLAYALDRNMEVR